MVWVLYFVEVLPQQLSLFNLKLELSSQLLEHLILINDALLILLINQLFVVDDGRVVLSLDWGDLLQQLVLLLFQLAQVLLVQLVVLFPFLLTLLKIL